MYYIICIEWQNGTIRNDKYNLNKKLFNFFKNTVSNYIIKQLISYFYFYIEISLLSHNFDISTNFNMHFAKIRHMHNIFNQSIANAPENMNINYNKHSFYISKYVYVYIYIFWLCTHIWISFFNFSFTEEKEKEEGEQFFFLNESWDHPEYFNISSSNIVRGRYNNRYNIILSDHRKFSWHYNQWQSHVIFLY